MKTLTVLSAGLFALALVPGTLAAQQVQTIQVGEKVLSGEVLPRPKAE